MNPDSGDITHLLSMVKSGDAQARNELVGLVYNNLRTLAGQYMRRERPDHTLQPTALVHEVFLRLFDKKAVDWQSRAHFFAVAAQTMRRILVDYARSFNAEKRPGKREKLSLESALIFTDDQSEELLALDEALQRLAKLDVRQHKIVEMRFFGGLSCEEVAELLGVSARTVKRDWTMARAWLHAELAESGA